MIRPAIAGASLIFALAVVGVTATQDVARAADNGGYADSIDHALQMLRAASADDRSAARRAADVLEAGTGQSQLEILGDLRRDPPDVADARDRLSALAVAVRSPAFAPEPGKSRRAVDDILAEPRYAALRQGPSLGDRIKAGVIRLLVWLLSQTAVAVASGLWRVLAVAGAVVLAVAVAVLTRSARWAGRPEARLPPLAAASRRRDHFFEADRMAAAGDYAGALRELAGGVAGALGDDLAWEASPLTVRELFSKASEPASLRPLLLAFEAAVYGGRPPDGETYRSAETAAAPFRGRQAAARAA